MRAGVRARRSHAMGDRAASLKKLAGENPDVAVAMRFSELDDLFFDDGRVRFRIGEHQLLRDGVVHSVGFYVKIVVVTDDKCHLIESTSNEQSYKIFSPDRTASRQTGETQFVVVVIEKMQTRESMR
jgi:hypothetical protein